MGLAGPAGTYHVYLACRGRRRRASVGAGPEAQSARRPLTHRLDVALMLRALDRPVVGRRATPWAAPRPAGAGCETRSL